MLQRMVDFVPFCYFLLGRAKGNIIFYKFLELVPEVREPIHDFYSSYYASCSDYLGNLKANLLLDIHLHDHVEMLYTQIRIKNLIRTSGILIRFVSVDLNMMASAFKTTVVGLQKELEVLITDNKIQQSLFHVDTIRDISFVLNYNIKRFELSFCIILWMRNLWWANKFNIYI